MSGMTLFDEGGFVIGREAFSSQDELSKTVLQELYRLNTCGIGATGQAAQSAVTSETKNAFEFAERAFEKLFK